MKLHTKSFIFIATSSAVLAVLLTLSALSAYHAFSSSSVSAQSRMAAEIVRISLTEEMVQGVIAHRASLLTRLKHVPGIEGVRVVRSQLVVNQFGPGLESESSYNDIEQQVMQTGEVVEQLNEGDRIIYQTTIPYIASKAGAVNCLQCHEANEGDVLGAVSMNIDLTEQRAEAIGSIVAVIIPLLLFCIAFFMFLRRLLAPVIQTTTQLQRVVKNAEVGIFSGRLEKISNDEIGEIVDSTNHLMQSLEESIGVISSEIESLTEFTSLSNDKNQLKRTLGAVQNMVDASRFKQAIENDRNLVDVYARIRRILHEKFKLQRYSLYELDNVKKRLQCVFADGLPESSELWCNAEVLIHADACRACRTAQIVLSSEDPLHCPSFAGNTMQQHETLLYTCIPVMFSGTVGGVLQLAFTPDQQEHMDAILPAIRIYLGAAAPVIEARRLMQSLKESAMRDAMTDLYNRRFLEEYLDVLTANAERKSNNVGVLMCDVDYFKQVNDTLGHEAGDTVLIEVARTLQQVVRPTDLVIRYGGEEFLTLLVDIDEKMTLVVAERIRKGVEEHIFKTADGKLNKTISIGAAIFPMDREAFWECVKYADLAMYQAKETGRNQVVRFTPGMLEKDS